MAFYFHPSLLAVSFYLLVRAKTVVIKEENSLCKHNAATVAVVVVVVFFAVCICKCKLILFHPLS